MPTEIENKILKSCEALFPEVMNFTKNMVSQYGVLHQEQGVLGVVEQELNKLKLPVERVKIDHNRLQDHPLFAPVEWNYDDKYNLVSTLNPDAEGKSIVLNGHLDVVPANPFHMWTKRPDEPWEKDGWLYGRGAGDMLSGVAAMIYAVHAIKHAGFEINSPLTIQAVVEEECTGNGALACLEGGYGGDFVLIPEPFGPTIYSGQIGVLWFKVCFQGKPGHVLDTAAGENAIEQLLLVVPYLKELEAELNKNHRTPPYDKFDHPFNFNLGKMDGGNWASSVPAYAEIEARIGFPPGMSVDEIMLMVREKIAKAADDLSAFKQNKPELSFHGFRSEGHLVDMETPGIQLLSECHAELTGQPPEPYLSTCTSDLCAFHFHSKTSGTCYGPVAKNIHGVDECVEIKSIAQTMQTYALFLARWCEVVPKHE